MLDLLFDWGIGFPLGLFYLFNFFFMEFGKVISCLKLFIKSFNIMNP